MDLYGKLLETDIAFEFEFCKAFDAINNRNDTLKFMLFPLVLKHGCSLKDKLKELSIVNFAPNVLYMRNKYSYPGPHNAIHISLLTRPCFTLPKHIQYINLGLEDATSKTKTYNICPQCLSSLRDNVKIVCKLFDYENATYDSVHYYAAGNTLRGSTFIAKCKSCDIHGNITICTTKVSKNRTKDFIYYNGILAPNSVKKAIDRYFLKMQNIQQNWMLFTNSLLLVQDVYQHLIPILRSLLLPKI